MKSSTSIARVSQLLLPGTLVFVILVLWEVSVHMSRIEAWLLPPPTAIVNELIASYPLFISHGYQTVIEAICGFLLAIVVAVMSAFLIDVSVTLRKMIYPLLVLSQTIPIIAVAPLMGIWLGLGLLPKVLVVALVCFFPIAIALADGLVKTDRDMLNVMRTMGASRMQIYRMLKLPTALPYFFSGLRIASSYCIMGAVIAEWLGAEKGLGILLTRASKSFLTDRVFATIFVISLLSMILYGLIEWLARKFLAWQIKTEEIS